HVTEPSDLRLRHGEFVIPAHVVTKVLLLIDGLPRGALAQLGRTIRREHEKWDPAFMRLEDRRKVIRTRRAARTDQRHRAARPTCEPKREEPGRTFIEHRNTVDRS